MKKILVLLPLLLMTACAVTGPAEDKWDEEEKEDRINLSGILGKSSNKKTAEAKAENEALRARIERLEKNRQSGAASTQSSGASSSSQDGSVSFREWSKARENGSSDYDEFKEYQKWLEFKKYKEQSQK